MDIPIILIWNQIQLYFNIDCILFVRIFFFLKKYFARYKDIGLNIVVYTSSILLYSGHFVVNGLAASTDTRDNACEQADRLLAWPNYLFQLGHLFSNACEFFFATFTSLCLSFNSIYFFSNLHSIILATNDLPGLRLFGI